MFYDHVVKQNLNPKALKYLDTFDAFVGHKMNGNFG